MRMNEDEKINLTHPNAYTEKKHLSPSKLRSVTGPWLTHMHYICTYLTEMAINIHL